MDGTAATTKYHQSLDDSSRLLSFRDPSERVLQLVCLSYRYYCVRFTATPRCRPIHRRTLTKRPEDTNLDLRVNSPPPPVIIFSQQHKITHDLW